MRHLSKHSVARDPEGELQFDSVDEAFELLGMDLPERLMDSIPAKANIASFLVDNDVFGMDEDAFTRRLEEDRE